MSTAGSKKVPFEVCRPEVVEFGEEHVFVGRKFVVTVRQGEAPDLRGVRRRMETDLLRWGPAVILYAIMDRIVNHYILVVAGLEDEIETSDFDANADVSRRTCELSREVVQLPQAVKPVTGMLTVLVDRTGDGFFVRLRGHQDQNETK